jgi:hypothetical protein
MQAAEKEVRNEDGFPDSRLKRADSATQSYRSRATRQTPALSVLNSSMTARNRSRHEDSEGLEGEDLGEEMESEDEGEEVDEEEAGLEDRRPDDSGNERRRR